MTVVTPLPTLLRIHPVSAGSGSLSAPVSGVVIGIFVSRSSWRVIGPLGTCIVIALSLLSIIPLTPLSPGRTIASGLGKKWLKSPPVPLGTLRISGVTLVPLVIRITSGPLSGWFPVVQTRVMVALPRVLVFSLHIALAGKVISRFRCSSLLVSVRLRLAAFSRPALTLRASDPTRGELSYCSRDDP